MKAPSVRVSVAVSLLFPFVYAAGNVSSTLNGNSVLTEEPGPFDLHQIAPASAVASHLANSPPLYLEPQADRLIQDLLLPPTVDQPIEPRRELEIESQLDETHVTSSAARPYGGQDAQQQLPRHRRPSSRNGPLSQDVRSPSKTYWCPRCDDSFDEVKQLKRHCDNVHEEQGLQCPECMRWFVRRERFVNHYRQDHGDLPEDLNKLQWVQKRFVHACGICAECRYLKWSDYFKHIVGHCKAGVEKSTWCPGMEAEALLSCQDTNGVWAAVQKHLSIDPQLFLRWAAGIEPRLLQRLEGDRWDQTLEAHLCDVEVVLRALHETYTIHVLGGTWHNAIESLPGQTGQLDHPHDQQSSFQGNSMLEATVRQHLDLNSRPDSNPFAIGVRMQWQPFGDLNHDAFEDAEPSAPLDGDRIMHDPAVLASPGISANEHDNLTGQRMYSPVTLQRNAPANAGTADELSTLRLGDGFVEGHQDVLSLLHASVQAGNVPSSTSGDGLLCGLHAAIGSINGVLEALTHGPHAQQLLQDNDVYDRLFANGAPTQDYFAFLVDRLLQQGFRPGTVGWAAAWSELTRPQYWSVEQIIALPDFLRQQGLLLVDIRIGVFTAGGQARDGSIVPARAWIPGGAPHDAEVAWLHHNNANLLRGEIEHWSMFRRGGDMRDVIEGAPHIPSDTAVAPEWSTINVTKI